MSNQWPKVPLGEVLTRSEETIALQPDKEYREITVKLWGKGVVLRGIVSGAGIAAQRRYVARSGHFILSRIDARNGALGVVPPELDGAVVTNDFPLFNVNGNKSIVDYLGWMCRTASFVDECLRASEGTTNRVRLQEVKFLAREIPLPSLAEQQWIVARINELVAQIQEARLLRQQALEDSESLLVCLAHRRDLTDLEKQSAGWRRISLGQCIKISDDMHRVSANVNYPNLGIYSFGKGLFHKQPIEGIATSASSLRRVKEGQFIYSRLFAFEGSYGMVTKEYDGCFVSNEYPTFECDPELVRVEFLNAYFKAPSIWKEVAVGSKGLGDRRQRVQPEQVLNHIAWIPPLELQNRLAQVQIELDRLRRLQAETVVELDALLPSILDRAFKGEL